MPYRRLEFKEGYYYHVYSRGNEKRDIFCDNEDCHKFLKSLFVYAELHSVSILSYCLLKNHYHLVVRQNGVDSISKLIHKLEVSYVMFFNRKYNRVGHLFGGVFKARLVERDNYLLTLSAYVHLNPLKHSECKYDELENYKWSSYRGYLNYKQALPIEKGLVLNMVGGASKYRDFISTLKCRFLKTTRVHKTRSCAQIGDPVSVLRSRY